MASQEKNNTVNAAGNNTWKKFRQGFLTQIQNIL